MEWGRAFFGWLCSNGGFSSQPCLTDQHQLIAFFNLQQENIPPSKNRCRAARSVPLFSFRLQGLKRTSPSPVQRHLFLIIWAMGRRPAKCYRYNKSLCLLGGGFWDLNEITSSCWGIRGVFVKSLRPQNLGTKIFNFEVPWDYRQYDEGGRKSEGCLDIPNSLTKVLQGI